MGIKKILILGLLLLMGCASVGGPRFHETRDVCIRFHMADQQTIQEEFTKLTGDPGKVEAFIHYSAPMEIWFTPGRTNNLGHEVEHALGIRPGERDLIWR